MHKRLEIVLYLFYSHTYYTNKLQTHTLKRDCLNKNQVKFAD